MLAGFGRRLSPHGWECLPGERVGVLTAGGWGCSPTLWGRTPAHVGVAQRACGRPGDGWRGGERTIASMRCGSGFDEGAAAGEGELVGGVDATWGDSDILGEFDETLCGTR